MTAKPSDRSGSFSSAEKVINDATDGSNNYDEFASQGKSGEVIEPPADMVRGVAGKLSPWTMLVVIMELCERFAYYGASLMFNIYLQKVLGRSKSEAVALNRVNQFMSYATTVLGAIIADQFLGKFKTI
ncbi:hypothetical protein LPJ70_005760, partial [Coemansia sp. RSA 2708]